MSMLPKLYRLKSDGDFARLAKSRKSAYEKLVGVKVRENNLSHSRYGIVVGLKVSKKAVERNKIKRQLREIIRSHLSELKTGYDVMIMALKPSVGADFKDIETQTVKALKKVKMMD